MARIEYITEGTEFKTLEGYLVITGNNGNLCYCDEYTSNEEGEYILSDERMLTVREIAHIMKEVDGKNHNLVYQKGE